MWNRQLRSTATFLLRIPLVILGCWHYRLFVCLFVCLWWTYCLSQPYGFCRQFFLYSLSFSHRRHVYNCWLNKRYLLIHLVGMFMMYPRTKLQWGRGDILIQQHSSLHTFSVYVFSWIHSPTWRFHSLRTICTVLTAALLKSQVICDFFFRLLNPEILNMNSLLSFETSVAIY